MPQLSTYDSQLTTYNSPTPNFFVPPEAAFRVWLQARVRVRRAKRPEGVTMEALRHPTQAWNGARPTAASRRKTAIRPSAFVVARQRPRWLAKYSTKHCKSGQDLFSNVQKRERKQPRQRIKTTSRDMRGRVRPRPPKRVVSLKLLLRFYAHDSHFRFLDYGADEILRCRATRHGATVLDSIRGQK